MVSAANFKMFADQISWIKDHRHERIITEQNGLNSLKLALEADQLARI